MFVNWTKRGIYMRVEFDGIPAGVTILINGVLVVGTGKKEVEEEIKESA